MSNEMKKMPPELSEALNKNLLNIMEGSPASPCSLPCPKCGSTDIHRKIHLKRETWDDWKPRRRENEFVSVDTYSTRAKKDCIQHHCRCCQWVWETAPLNEENSPARSSRSD